MHLCIGQEATAVGACAALAKEDKISGCAVGAAMTGMRPILECEKS